MEKLLTSIPDSDAVSLKPIPRRSAQPNAYGSSGGMFPQAQRLAGGSFGGYVELAQLSPRKQEVLRLLGRGSPNHEIAKRLLISEGTVKTHVTHLMNQLNLRNRVQLAIYANSVFLGSEEQLP
jgi:DNA-binding NarL/FixJ family response regulator